VTDDAERDRRTVFVTQLSQRVKRRDLIEFFGKSGKVKDAKVVEDKRTGRSKGYDYGLNFVT
jgi:RNA-binding protein 23/39